ncbi:hypothetical protein OJ997_16210 [Solirubrobacter phytolaccae]|uniref:Ig-like domain-containing protein n=1 Tax=Solirubrobacter phytolaccae TaxID=1404360 RepID=A0A9X3S8S7_9ACTN|nr:hypothetical protein [Solirubrobacter phytolaccae]MDA0181848.1 hypothetical protein [Solirubrobacter phytolaccae]
MTLTRRLRVLLACAAALVLAPSAAHAATITSTTSGDWDDPATWAGGVVPGSSDAVVVDDAVTLTGDVTVAEVTVNGGAMLTLDGSRLTSSGDVSLLGDSYTTSWLTDGPLDVAGDLLIQNTAISNATITAAGGNTEFSGPLPGDTEASSFWTNSTFTQNFGGVTFSGHRLAGAVDPVLNDANLTVRGVNDLDGRQLTLTGWGGVFFEPTAVTGIGGAPMLNVGALTVSGMHQTTVDWSGIVGGAADTDRVNLIAAAAGDATDLIYSSAGSTTFGGPLTGESLYVTYSGNPRPAANPLPSVSSSSSLPGHAEEGDTITCDPGTWTPDDTKVYSWASDGNEISGETGSTFEVTSAQLTTDITCTVSVTVNGVTGTEESSNAVHADVAPGNILEPEVSPTTAAVGDVLTCDEGLWSAVSPSYAYTWERDGVTIGGATARTYTTVSADGDTDVTCSVVATDGLASSAPVQSITAAAVAGGPSATTPPSATSTRTPTNRATTGDVITCDPGVWNPDGAKAYAWKRNGTPIAGATATTYTVVVADLGTDLKCAVTVTASGESGSADSAAVTVVATPTNSVAPAITGTYAAGKGTPGEPLTCGAGTWTGSPTYGYSWKRGATEVATTSAYTPVGGDVGATLTCTVTATVNTIAGAPATTAGVTIFATPGNTTAPAITGTPVVGKTRLGLALSCTPGTWTGGPTFTYAWERDGTPIGGATAATYTPAGADLNTELTCVVSATANGLTTLATTTGVDVVAVAENTTPPAVTGTHATGKGTPGEQLTCGTGAWTLSATYSFSWKRGTTEVATMSTYTPVLADVGATLTCAVTADANGIPSAPAASTGVTIFAAPENTTAPAITGTPVAGKTRLGLALTCAPGTWTHGPAFTYAWERDGTPIGGATSATYTPAGADLNTELTCTVTGAANGLTGTPVTATGVDVVETAENTVAPSITGTLAAAKSLPGTALTCDAGTWTLSPTLDYAWKRGSTTVATTGTYTPVAADAGATLTCEVTGTANGVPSAAVASTGVAVLPNPDNTAAPALSGSGIVGEALTCATGSWAGTPDLFVRWLRGDTVVASGSSVYTLVRADRNAELRCKVTATTLGAERTASSAPVTVKAAAPITITEQPEAVITTRGARVAYTLAPDVTVTGCTLNGTALASCASPIALDSLASTADHALVINLRNEYGEDETRTVNFATRVAGPSVAITNWPEFNRAPRFRLLALKFRVDAGALVACTFDGRPVSCSAAGADLLVPRSGVHVFEVTATDVHGGTGSDKRTLEVVEVGSILPVKVRGVAGSTITIPSVEDLRGHTFKANVSGVTVVPIGSGDLSWGLLIKLPAKPGKVRLDTFHPSDPVNEIGRTVIEVTQEEATTVDETAGGLIDANSPLTCPKGAAGSFYVWYIDGKLVRTDTSNVFPAKLLPKTGEVSCAVNDPIKGLSPQVKTLIDNDVRLALKVVDNALSFVVSKKVWVEFKVAQVTSYGQSSSAKPVKARYTTLKTKKQTLRRGWTRISLGRKLPKSGYRVTVKIKRGKRYSKPLVLSKG